MVRLLVLVMGVYIVCPPIGMAYLHRPTSRSAFMVMVGAYGK